MTFKRAVCAVAQLANAYRDGLQALRPADRARVICAPARNLKGSLDIDETLAPTHPNASRWDYGIGHYNGRTEDAIWVEVHSASSDHVSQVIRKVEWLRSWLGANAIELSRLTRRTDGYVWLAAGNISLQRGSRQARQLAMAGISFPRKRLQLR